MKVSYSKPKGERSYLTSPNQVKREFSDFSENLQRICFQERRLDGVTGVLYLIDYRPYEITIFAVENAQMNEELITSFDNRVLPNIRRNLAAYSEKRTMFSRRIASCADGFFDFEWEQKKLPSYWYWDWIKNKASTQII